MIYRNILKPILFRFSPELVHAVFVKAGAVLGRWLVTRYVVGLFYGYRGNDISKKVDGITYRTPVILSAGFDYNGQLTRILPSLGFGGVEVGSVTARPCKGNAGPTLTRLPNSRAIIVNKGLKNDGVEAIITRLKETPREPDFVIGISIAKTNDKQSADTDEAVSDYCLSFRRLNEDRIGDYYTINISCPNAFDGETFTTPTLLAKLLSALDAIECTKPVYVKMPINLPWESTRDLLEVITRHRISGVIFGNLNKNYDDIADRNERPASYKGGVSGVPCFNLSNELIEKSKLEFGDRLTIIGCGGIMSVSDALHKFEIGSELIHMITGMIYEGPSLIKKICREYSRSMK